MDEFCVYIVRKLRPYTEGFDAEAPESVGAAFLTKKEAIERAVELANEWGQEAYGDYYHTATYEDLDDSLGHMRGRRIYEEHVHVRASLHARETAVFAVDALELSTDPLTALASTAE